MFYLTTVKKQKRYLLGYLLLNKMKCKGTKKYILLKCVPLPYLQGKGGFLTDYFAKKQRDKKGKQFVQK